MTDDHHDDLPADAPSRIKVLEALLVEKGLVHPAALDALIDTYETQVGPRKGAQALRVPGLETRTEY